MAVRWYLTICHSGFERAVAGSIGAQAAECGLAHLIDNVVVPVDGGRLSLPGYVLIHCEMTDEFERLLRAIPHVAGFIGRDNQPMPIADAEIDRICAKYRGSERPQATRS
jgi:transcriptional antiterminator NusG